MFTAILRSVCDQAEGNHAEVSPLVFTDGEDTPTFGGIISGNGLQLRISGIRLAVESDILITQLVNITNIGFSDHVVKISVGAEDFGSELSSLKIYLVSPSGKETLALEIDNSGNIITENIPVNIPHGEEWSIKLLGHYDSGTCISQSNSLTLYFRVVG